MVSRYSNEMNAFRSGIEERVGQHSDKLDAVNKALGIKADKVFENAKKISDSGSKLLESGIGGGVGATALGKYARKGIDKLNAFKQKGQDVLDNVEGKVREAGSKIEGKIGEVGDKVSKVSSKVDVDDVLGQVESKVQSATQSARDSVAPEQTSEGARPAVAEEGAESNPTTDWKSTYDTTTQDTIGYERGGSKTTPLDEEGESKLDSLMEGTGKSDALDVGDETKLAVADASTGAEESSTATGAGEGGGEALAETGLAETGVDLEEAAASTSWLAFLGIPEILAAAGAVAGVAAAGVGIADAVKSGDVASKAQAMVTTTKRTGFQAAGTYVVPTSDSLS